MRRIRLLRLIHVLIAALLVGGLLVTAWSARADSTRRRVRVPILMYHYIGVVPPNADIYRLDLTVTPRAFEEQLAWLRGQGFTTVTLDDLVAALTQGAPLPPRPVILTFDDGYADAYTNAFPLLSRYGMTGTFFVVTEWIDSAQPGYLTWDQARAMAAAGMTIASHTRSHPDLTDGCDYDCRIYQILGSVQTIEAEIGVRPRFFCYPSGRYDAGVLDVLRSVGIEAAVTTQAGTLHTSDDLLELSRARMRNTTTVTDLAWMVYQWTE